MKINIIELISSLDNYVILKYPNGFPDIRLGGDVDLLVEDSFEAEKSIISCFLAKAPPTYTCEVVQHDTHTHIDITMDGNLVVRLDLIASFSFFKKICVSTGYATHILTNKIEKNFEGSVIYVPSEIDDWFVRYIEYLEYFDDFPSKEKHINYLYSNLTSDEWSLLIAYAHRYIKFNHKQFTASPQIFCDCSVKRPNFFLRKMLFIKRYLGSCYRFMIKPFRPSSIIHSSRKE